MSLPTRPVSHASIEAIWGQTVHDWTFTPVGTELYGTVITVCGTTPTQIRLDAALNDPGGWLDASPLPGNATAPAGSDGIYLMMVRVVTVNGTAGEFTRGYVSINGTILLQGLATNNAGTNVVFTISDIVTVTAGDIFTVSGQRIGSTSPDVRCASFRMVRLADAIGS